MSDPRWVIGEAAYFLRYLLDNECIGLDWIHEEMEYHYQRPFSTDTAAEMRGAMYDAVGDA